MERPLRPPRPREVAEDIEEIKRTLYIIAENLKQVSTALLAIASVFQPPTSAREIVREREIGVPLPVVEHLRIPRPPLPPGLPAPLPPQARVVTIPAPVSLVDSGHVTDAVEDELRYIDLPSRGDLLMITAEGAGLLLSFQPFTGVKGAFYLPVGTTIALALRLEGSMKLYYRAVGGAGGFYYSVWEFT